MRVVHDPRRKRDIVILRVFRGTAFACLLMALAGAAYASDEQTLDGLSDDQLEARMARWASLSVDDRRALLTEIHKRMVAAGKKPVVRIRTERRYGYRIRRADGSVVEVHKREGVVRYHRLDPDRSFGVGFERRYLGEEGRGERGEGRPDDKQAPLSERPVPAAGQRPIYQLPLPGGMPLESQQRAEAEDS